MNNKYFYFGVIIAGLNLGIITAAQADLATEHTQWMNHLELIEQLKEAVTQTDLLKGGNGLLEQSETHLRDSFRLLDQNTRSIEDHEWGNTLEQLNELAQIAQEDDTLAYSANDIDREFDTRYKSYDSWSNNNDVDMQQEYRAWNVESTNNSKAALKAAQHHNQQFAAEDKTLKQLEAMSEGSDGQLKALQTNNQLTAQQVRQTQLARQLDMTQLQFEVTAMQIKREEEAAQKAQAEKFYATPIETVTDDGKGF